MRKLFYLAVKRSGMANYAAHGRPKLMTEEEFLADPEVQRTLKLSARFGDKVRLMEEDPNPTNPNIFIRELV